MMAPVGISNSFLICLAFLVTGQAFPDESDTTIAGDTAIFLGPRNAGSRILGGNEVVPGEYPWMAYLSVYRDGGEVNCGGTLISESWIMTAAHCVRGVTLVRVTLGAHNLSAAEPSRVTIKSDQIHLHPNYSSSAQYDDIALVKLPTSVNVSARIRPINLIDTGNLLFENSSVTVTGWGYLTLSTSVNVTSDVLREYTISTISNTRCQQNCPSTITSNMICTSETNGNGTCPGDSGGPMIYQLENGSWTQIGITSFGCRSCGVVAPKGFTRVQRYIGWISSVTSLVIITTPPTTTSSTTTKTTTTTTPKPVTITCQNKPDGNYPHPTDCSKFIMCSNQTPYSFNCPTGLVFNPTSDQCDYRENVPQCQ